MDTTQETRTVKVEQGSRWEEEVTIPGPWHTIDQMKRYNMAQGCHFFDQQTMRWFGSRIAPGIVAGRFFIASEQDRYGGAWNGERRYTVRCMKDDGTVCELLHNGFGQFATLREARKALREALS